ncbi:hypothetical protein GQ42DRAFT_110727, partial [Ramicandelaber brevisporus]
TQPAESLIDEQLSRTIAMLGEDGVKRVRKSFVVVVGVGGVGSHAATLIARSGVEKLRLIDFDQITVSSLNRHAVAGRSDVGHSKVEVLRDAIHDFAPHTVVEIEREMFTGNRADYLLRDRPDYVVDAIDNIDTKIELIEYCVKNNLPVIASMGAGGKTDPSRIQIADITETFEDPLARAVRKRLRKKGINDNIPVVYSTEKPDQARQLRALDESLVSEADEFAVLPGFRSRIMPVLGTLPAIFGMTLASYVVCVLAGHPVDPLPVKKRDSVYKRVTQELYLREASLCSDADEARATFPFHESDVAYIYEEVWRGRCAATGAVDKTTLIRWNPLRPLSVQNCVCLAK